MQHRNRAGRLSPRALIATAMLLAALAPATAASAGVEVDVLRADPPAAVHVRWFPTGDAGVGQPAGMTYIRELDALAMFGFAEGQSWLARVTPREDLLGVTPITDVAQGASLAFDPEHQVLRGFTGPAVFEVELADMNDEARAVMPTYLARPIGRPAGATYAWDDTAVVLDAASRELVRFEAGAQQRIDLRGHGARLGGLAFNAGDGLVYVAALDRDLLLGIDARGDEVTRYDIGHLELLDVTAMAFGPTADPTDEQANTSLYVLEPHEDTAHVVELALPPIDADDPALPPLPLPDGVGPPPTAGVQADVATLLRTANLSALNPPSPDSAGVAYLPSADRLMVSDSEVEEMPIYQGANLYRLRRTNNNALVDTGTTTRFSNEPTGLAFDQANNRLIVSDDDADQIALVLPGGDGRFGTSDDSVGEFNVTNSDSEGVAYDTDQRQIFIIDGVGREVYRINPGPNGTYGNSDDIKSNFDVGQFGAGDPEGIAYDARFGSLLVLDHKSQMVYEVNKQGELLRTIDVRAANAKMAAGIEIAPSSADATRMSLWIVDRGVDNCTDSNENDGKLYELTTGGTPPPPNTPPTVSISSPSNGTQFPSGSSITFTGTAADGESGSLTAALQWTSDRQGSIGAGGSFSRTLEDGAHTITATATDPQGASGSASVSIIVGNAPSTIDVAVAASSDDAEEQPSGSVKLSSSDLELGLDRSTPQTVGMRFVVPIPRGATVSRSWIQFTVDESSTGIAEMTVTGQASGNATTFTSAGGNVSARPRTSASVAWSPPDWPSSGARTAAQRTADLSAIINQIVGRSDWSSGNGLALFITGSGMRIADAVEGGASNAPTLHLEYTLTPASGPPTVQITSPDDGSSHALGATISFAGSASDPDDGNVTSSLKWTSDLQGQIGTGGSFSRTLDAGTHTIKATATDSDSNTGEAFITVIVENQRPVVTITAPADGTGFASGSSVTFTGTASDAEQGNIAGSLAWSSSAQGSLGTGASVTATMNDGTHTITASVTDTHGATGSAQITIVVGAAPTTATLNVTTAADDGEERVSNGQTRTNSGDLDLVNDKTVPQIVGIRYAAPIPAGATILSATMQFRADESDQDPVSLTIQAQAADNAPAITTASFNLSSRARTTASQAWAPGAWTAGQSGLPQQTPDLTAVIQEVVDRPGWVSGGSMLIIISGSGERVADSFEGGAAPTLTIEWA